MVDIVVIASDRLRFPDRMKVQMLEAPPPGPTLVTNIPRRSDGVSGKIRKPSPNANWYKQDTHSYMVSCLYLLDGYRDDSNIKVLSFAL